MSYSIYEGFESVGKLSPYYEIIHKKKRLTGFKFQGQQWVALASVWINGCPSADLKGIETVVLPQSSGNHKKKREIYHLDFQNQWDWFYKDKTKKIQPLHLSCYWSEGKTSIVVPPFLKISGIKKCVQDQLPYREDEEYVLCFNEYPLYDEQLTVAECGIRQNGTLVFLSESRLLESQSHHQMGTGSIYSPVEMFTTFVSEIPEKIDLVCQLHYSDDQNKTAFLISPFLIMTNAHGFVKGKVQDGIARFFYEKEGKRDLKLEVKESTVCWSPPPSAIERPTTEKLDYAILQLKPPQLDRFFIKLTMTFFRVDTPLIHSWIAFEKLGLLAKDFFEKAQKEYEKKQRQTRQQAIDINGYANRVKKKRAEDKRANIIQHPIEENTVLRKQICFRENQIFPGDSLLLHYRSLTRHGSSGSPVIDDKGNWIGLHYSSCKEIDSLLYSHRTQLLKALGYSYDNCDDSKEIYKDDSDDSREKNTDEDQSKVHIYIKDEEEGMCFFSPKTGRKFTLSDLIFIKKKERTKGESFLFSFLEKQGVKGLIKNHLLCNTAIRTSCILADLEESGQKIKEATQAALKEWEDFNNKLQLLKKMLWVKTHQQQLFMGAGALFILWTAGKIIWWVGRKIGEAKARE